MNKAKYFLAQPSVFKPGVLIYPPLIKEVVSNERFSLYIKILTQSQEEIEDEFLEAKRPLDKYPTPFEFLLNNSYHNKDYEKLAKESFQFFIHQEVTFLYEQKLVIVGNLEEVLKSATSIDDLTTIKEEEFFAFQNRVRESIGIKVVDPPIIDEDPRVAEIKRKARYRDKLKAKQAAKKSEGISLFTSLVSICCMGLGITPLTIGEMSYVAMESILKKYQEKEKYELDIDSLLAGADSKKIKPKYWIRNFEE